MKKILIIAMLLFSTVSIAQEEPSYWNVQPNHELTLNYGMFGKSVARGAGIGGLGYVLGMYVSGNKPVWGIVGSMLAVNIPLVLDNGYDAPERVIGYNLGAFGISFGLTFAIELHRRENKPRFKIVKFLRPRN